MRGSLARTRLLIMLVVGVAGAVVTGLTSDWIYAPALGWAAATAVFCVLTWWFALRSDAEETRTHATREDPSRAVTDVLILAANVASLAAIVVLIVRDSHEHGTARQLLAGGALLCVALSWLLVQTLYTLRYARAYYSPPIGGVDFNQDESPDYHDFAYLAFTMGMTYQVSDTNLTQSVVRAIALRHGLLSYVFGAVILATAINLVVTLSTTT